MGKNTTTSEEFFVPQRLFNRYFYRKRRLSWIFPVDIPDGQLKFSTSLIRVNEGLFCGRIKTLNSFV